MKKEKGLVELGLAGILLGGVLSCGGGYDPAETRSEKAVKVQQPVFYGTPTEHYQVPFIAGLTLGNDGTIPWCTAELIKPDLLITAAHCVDGIEPRWAAYGSSDINQNDPDCLFEIFGTAYHPGYNPIGYSMIAESIGNGEEIPPGYDTHDIAVVLMKNPIPKAIFANVFSEDKYEELLLNNALVNLCGYGQDEHGYSGVLNCAQVPIRKIYGSDLVFGANWPNGNDGFPGTHSDACYGDSGGPTFIILDDGSVFVITTTSRLPSEAPYVTCGFGYVGVGIGAESNWNFVVAAEEKLRQEKENSEGGSGGSGGSGGDGNCGAGGAGAGGSGGAGGDGICGGLPVQKDPEKENPKYLSGQNKGNCSFSNNYNVNVFGLAALLGAAGFVGLRRRKKY